MSKWWDYFQEQLEQNPQVKNHHSPCALDALMADEKIQKAIRHSKRAQLAYVHLEEKITTRLIHFLDSITRNAIGQMSTVDFMNVKGFESKCEATEKQKKYIETRDTLEFYIKSMITNHNSRDSQTHAFRRLITVANYLFKHKNYDACSIILFALAPLKTEVYVDAMPKSIEEQYNYLSKLMTPPFSKLNQYLQKHKCSRDIVPIPIMVRKIQYIQHLQENLNVIVEGNAEKKLRNSETKVKTKILNMITTCKEYNLSIPYCMKLEEIKHKAARENNSTLEVAPRPDISIKQEEPTSLIFRRDTKKTLTFRPRSNSLFKDLNKRFEEFTESLPSTPRSGV
ncbi:MAG: hypothetical protein BGO90_04080 [Legionella sp. 40-6]|nr:hypothetical protein [Legionella sp.]OJX98935.1 MAG: hypothetical protein BGO90_04080 [Legionella sp. 40-6]